MLPRRVITRGIAGDCNQTPIGKRLPSPHPLIWLNSHRPGSALGLPLSSGRATAWADPIKVKRTSNHAGELAHASHRSKWETNETPVELAQPPRHFARCLLPSTRAFGIIQEHLRIVIKLGTGVPPTAGSRLIPRSSNRSSRKSPRSAARARKSSWSPAARSAGMGALGFDSRPANLAEKQACAAVGQSRLMSTYENFSPNTISLSRRCC